MIEIETVAFIHISMKSVVCVCGNKFEREKLKTKLNTKINNIIFAFCTLNMNAYEMAKYLIDSVIDFILLYFIGADFGLFVFLSFIHTYFNAYTHTIYILSYV